MSALQCFQQISSEFFPMGFLSISRISHGISPPDLPKGPQGSPFRMPGPAAGGAPQRLRGPGSAQPRHAAAAGGTPGGAAGAAVRGLRA